MQLNKSSAILLVLSGFFFSASASMAQDETKSEPEGSGVNSAKQAADSTQLEAKSEPAQEAMAEDDGKRPDFNTGKLTFEFRNTEWGKVIRWFADEAKLDLNMAVTPEGSFNYSSNGEFTLLQAMDVINSFLIREQGYILLRHANLIIVHDLNNEIPPTMIETIPITELDNRGEYELTQTEFDVSGFDGGKFSGDIERLIRDDQGGKQLLVESSEILFVRETGGRLRLIRKYLDMARTIASGKEESLKIVELKYITPEEVMTIASELIPLDDENSFEADGEKLKVVIQSFGNKFILRGTGKTMKRFEELVVLLDKETQVDETTKDLAQPVTKRYPVAADRELVLQVMRTMLAGTEGLRLALAEESGEIIAYATPEVHATIVEILSSLTSDASNFKVMQLNDYDADSMIEILNKMYGISDEAEAAPNQPVFMADPLYTDRLVAKAKPTQLQAIKELVDSIDPPIGEGTGYDKNYIQLEYRGKQADMAIQMIQDMYGALGRTNKFNVMRSKSAGGDSIRRIDRSEKPSDEGNPSFNQPIEQSPSNSTPAIPKSNEGNAKPDSRTNTTQSAPVDRLIRVNAFQEESTDDKKTAPKQGEMKTIDGAPILIRENPAGLMIVSDDLKALAEIKRLLDEYEEVINRPALPTIVELKHRKAIEMKDLLEMFLGLSSGDSGGGGGGLGGMLGGVAQNAIGGMAGQMVGGLLGGGGGLSDSGTVTSDLLTGDVRIDADALKNVLLVQANPIDMETIMEYVNYFDTDSPDQNPELDGRTYAIRIQYRDAAQLADVVKAQFPNRLETGKSQGQQQGNPQAQQLQMLQQLMRGGRGGRGGGGGSKTVEQSEPKMTVGVDAEMNCILITGPEFLYEQVRLLVQQLDTPDAVRDGTVVVVGLKNIRPDGIREAINTLQQENAAGGGGNAATRGGTTPRTGTNTPFNPATLFRGGMQGGGATPFSGFRGGIPGRGGAATSGRGGGTTRGGGGRGGRGGR